jgi:hypothetical protein
MIESRYWKEDLRSHAKRLEPQRTPRRWSERAVVNFEKELMVSFFMVRALLEREKLSKKVTDHVVPVARSPWNGTPVTKLNYWCVDELYDFDQTREIMVSLNFVSNQFVHARAIFSGRDKSRNWSEVLVCSDYEKKKAVYVVALSDIRTVFRLVAGDSVTWSKAVYDTAKGDYVVTSG